MTITNEAMTNALRPLALEKMRDAASELPCIAHLDDADLETLLDEVNWKDLGISVSHAMGRAVTPVVTGRILDDAGIPRVTAHVEFEFWDSAFDVCHLIEEYDFDCTAALENLASDTDEADLDAFLGYDRDSDEFLDEDLEPEDLDTLYRLSADYGDAPEWDGPFTCYITSGWDAWAHNRRCRAAKSAESDE